jgi:hypothetical protein
MNKMFKSPYLEMMLMTGVLALSYVGLAILTAGLETPPGGTSGGALFMILFGSFVISFGIAIVAVMAGIGGGVLFTPIMLAFTAVDSLIIRATGLIVAMFSGLVSTGPFMRRGLTNLKLCLWAVGGYGIGAFSGAQGAIFLAKILGPAGEGWIRVALGVIIFALVCYFIWGGKKVEWPEVKRVDGFSKWLNPTQPYYEESLDKVVEYKVARAGWIFLATIAVGVLSGFFGLGAGWAIVPALNLVGAVPIKVAAASSGAVLGMGDCIAVWPYLLNGAIIPLFVAPWLVGQVLGGLIGAYLLLRIKAGFVRTILIGILAFTSYGLISRGLGVLGVIGEIPSFVSMMVLAVCALGIVLALMGKLPGFKK